MITAETSRQLLEDFLSYPLNSTDAIFAHFENIPGAIAGIGNNALERYVCIPGKRKNKVVLVAHADTVWDQTYGQGAETTIAFTDGVFHSGNENCGIGADDRAGCAMLWALRDSGHTLLLVNGEEHGKVGARFLRQSNPALFRFLNRHQFFIELDWMGTKRCLYNQVDYTERFHTYITNTLGFQDDHMPGGSDLQILCHRICGVNIGVGYYNWHHNKEFLRLQEWECTLSSLKEFLTLSHSKFPISTTKRFIHFLKRVKHILGQLARRLFPFLFHKK